jgi:hypothetical protein
MSNLPRNADHLEELVGAVCSKGASQDDFAELNALLLSDEAARRFYLRYCQMHVAMRLELRAERAAQKICQRIGSEPPIQDVGECDIVSSRAERGDRSSPPPMFDLSSAPSQGVVTYFAGWPVAYLVATVIFGLGLAIGAFVHVSHPTDVVRQFNLPSPSGRGAGGEGGRGSLPSSIVARITGMVDCTWSDPETEALVGAYVPLGRKYALASGLMEITYDTGAKVILQGPVTYEVESPAGGYLAVGKLTARLDSHSEVSNLKSQISDPEPRTLTPDPSLSTLHSPLFTIKTPTAVVTDLGTEFGVEVDQSGATKSHVFRGRVEVRVAGGKEAEHAVQLGENESAQVNVGQGQVLTVTRATVGAATFTRKMPRRVPIRVFNTGQGWVEGSPDPHWQIVAISNITPSIRPYPALVTTVWDGRWMPNEFHQSQWISSVGGGLVVDGVIYTFRTTFDLAGLRAETARLKGAFAVDNHVEAIRLNGRSVPVPAHGYDLFQCWHSFAIHSGFADGVNVLEFDVENGMPEISPTQGSRMGLRVQLEGVAERKEEGR